METDWTFWVMFLLPLTVGLVSGWWLRGVKVEDDEMTREMNQSKANHPTHRNTNTGMGEWR